MGIAFSIVMMFVQPALNVKNPVLDLMRQNPGYVMYINISMVVGAVFTLVLLLAGIGLLMLRPWGRTLSIVYAIFAIISLIVNTVINYYFLFAPLMDKLAAATARPGKSGGNGRDSGHGRRHMCRPYLSDHSADFYVPSQCQGRVWCCRIRPINSAFDRGADWRPNMECSNRSAQVRPYPARNGIHSTVSTTSSAVPLGP